ncbi:MAG TPA: hypothetical protein ENJ08_12220 [Gammaproteobacteria bacterium]|nr:hypothetical protein [Gammaproteobacteria bacterium]
MSNQHKDLQDQLNRAMPIAKDIGLGDTLQELISAYNDLATKYNQLVALQGGNANLLADNTALKNINDRG